MNADPVHDLRAMKLDGLGADAEDPGDLLGRLAGSDQAKDLGLSLSAYIRLACNEKIRRDKGSND